MGPTVDSLEWVLHVPGRLDHDIEALNWVQLFTVMLCDTALLPYFPCFVSCCLSERKLLAFFVCLGRYQENCKRHKPLSFFVSQVAGQDPRIRLSRLRGPASQPPEAVWWQAHIPPWREKTPPKVNAQQLHGNATPHAERLQQPHLASSRQGLGQSIACRPE